MRAKLIVLVLLALLLMAPDCGFGPNFIVPGTGCGKF